MDYFDYETERVGTVVQYLNLINYDNYSHVELFRGQGDSSWELSPSLERVLDTSESITHLYADWADLGKRLLEDFKNHAAPFLNIIPSNDVEWMVQAQHYGLPTPLLDWTTNPLKALFFAVENPDLDDKNAAVFLATGDIYTTEEVNDSINDYFHCFYPKHINERITAQEGCFSLYPLPEEFEPFSQFFEDKDFCSAGFWLNLKIIIPATCKAQIRKELTKLGVTRRTIYPGLDSIADSIKRKLVDNPEY